jgi:hypothetical protein
MTYEEALCYWAKKRFNLDYLPVETIAEFYKGYGGGCETCGYGADEPGIEVWTLRTRQDPRQGNKHERHFLEGYGMTTIIKEIFEATQNDS